MPVVSDASVLICLGAIQQLDLLREFYNEVMVPDAVWREVTISGSSRPGAALVLQGHRSGWLRTCTPANRALAATLSLILGTGEAEAIALASELSANLLLIDETEGRIHARRLGIPVTGTLGVLMRARQAGKIPALRPLLSELVQRYHFRLHQRLFDSALRAVGE